MSCIVLSFFFWDFKYLEKNEIEVISYYLMDWTFLTVKPPGPGFFVVRFSQLEEVGNFCYWFHFFNAWGKLNKCPPPRCPYLSPQTMAIALHGQGDITDVVQLRIRRGKFTLDVAGAASVWLQVSSLEGGRGGLTTEKKVIIWWKQAGRRAPQLGNPGSPPKLEKARTILSSLWQEPVLQTPCLSVKPNADF